MSRETPRMLVLAPHSDDSVLGVGGTMARWSQAGGEVMVVTAATHMPPLYSREASQATVDEAKRAFELLGVRKETRLNIPALSVNQVPISEINRHFLGVLAEFDPHVLFVPFCDRHVDHRAVFNAAMVASRPATDGRKLGIVAAYEVLSSTYYNAPGIEPTFSPHWTVDITNTVDLKLQALSAFETQIGRPPHARSCEAVRALAIFRGSQAGMLSGESFQVIRMLTPLEPFALAF